MMGSKSAPSAQRMKEVQVNNFLKAVLTTPFLGPCIMAGRDNSVMYEQYDLHIVDSEEYRKDRNFFHPPPDKLTLFVSGFFCYCYTISWHERVLKRKIESPSDILYDWESSSRAVRAQEFEDVPIKKVAILGAPGVGKSGVFARLCGGGFPEAVSLVAHGEEEGGEKEVDMGARYRDKNVNVGARRVAVEGELGEGVLEFWDVPPDCQASHVEVTSGMALEGADLVVMVFDVR